MLNDNQRSCEQQFFKVIDMTCWGNWTTDLLIAKRTSYTHQCAGWVSVHFYEKWHHFVTPKTLLCFRVRVRVGLG